MNKNIIIGVVGVAVVAAAGYFFMNKTTGPGDGGAVPVPGAPMSMRELLGLGGAQRCTFTNSVENSESSGVVYVAGGKMRGDFTSLAAGQTIQSHMIVDGETSYLWSDAMPQGVKMAFADVSAQSGQGSNQSVDVNEKVDYSCSGWTTDANMFVLPAGVEFSDLSALLPPGGMPALDGRPGAVDPSGGTMPAGGVDAMQCAACEQAPDADARAQCLELLGCAAR